MILYTSPYMTAREALDIAKREHPLDLVARVEFLERQAYSCRTISDQACWLRALAITRNGHDGA